MLSVWESVPPCQPQSEHRQLVSSTKVQNPLLRYSIHVSSGKIMRQSQRTTSHRGKYRLAPAKLFWGFIGYGLFIQVCVSSLIQRSNYHCQSTRTKLWRFMNLGILLFKTKNNSCFFAHQDQFVLFLLFLRKVYFCPLHSTTPQRTWQMKSCCSCLSIPILFFLGDNGAQKSWCST